MHDLRLFRSIGLAACLLLGSASLALAQAPYLVIDLDPSVSDGTPASSIRHLASLDDQLLFTTCDGAQTALWTTLGDASSTVKLAVLSQEGCSTDIGRMTVAQDRVYFTVGIKELWTSDGTPSGTGRAYTLPGSCHFGEEMAAVGSKLLFTVFAPGVDQVWISNGTDDGTGPLVDVPGLNFHGGEAGYTLTSSGSRGLFMLQDASGVWDLFVTDGTIQGTESLQSGQALLQAPKGTLQAVDTAGMTYFYYRTSDSLQLWQTDGTAPGTSQYTPFPGDSASGLRDLVPLGGSLFAIREADANSTQLLRIDPGGANFSSGSTAQMVSEFSTQGDVAAASSSELSIVGSQLVFVADDGLNGRELWTSDGSAEGTTLLWDIAPGNLASNPQGLTVFDGRLYFSANAGDGLGEELWISDGTGPGTARLADLAEGGASSSPRQLYATSDRLYFTADVAPHGRELWATEGIAGPCVPSTTRLCLRQGRFAATVQWTDFRGQEGPGQSHPLTDDSGAFWFFGPDNLELMVKVIDGRDFNGNYWVYYGALSNVAFTLTVEDLESGHRVVYDNPSGEFASRGDTRALPGTP